MNFIKKINSFDKVPAWYGIAWIVPNANLVVCAPAPLHKLFSVVRRFWHKFLLTVKPSVKDKWIMECESLNKRYVENLAIKRIADDLYKVSSLINNFSTGINNIEHFHNNKYVSQELVNIVFGKKVE